MTPKPGYAPLIMRWGRPAASSDPQVSSVTCSVAQQVCTSLLVASFALGPNIDAQTLASELSKLSAHSAMRFLRPYSWDLG